MTGQPDSPLADQAVELVTTWLARAGSAAERSERVLAERLANLIADPEAVEFTMRFVDRVARPETHRAAAHQLEVLVDDAPVPAYLSPVDKALLRTGTLIATRASRLVMPLALKRMRSLVGHLVADADPKRLTKHLASQRTAGYDVNVNLLGEMILGEDEAARRFERTLVLVRRPDVDYVSVKISSIASQLDLWAYDETLERIKARLRTLYETAGQASPPTFVNLDMEEYEDLDLTLDAFQQLLDESPTLEAGIVLQTYLPDTFGALQRLTAWANRRHAGGGGTIKVRLVKGANLAMEQVEAAIHGWPQAPYTSKLESDANFKRCLDWLLYPERVAGVRVGVGSHNLFDVAWAHLLAHDRQVADSVEFEMLQGMAPSHAEIVQADTGSMLLYTPVVSATDFDVAIGYLFRRLEENASRDNFLRFLFSLQPGSEAFRNQERIFRSSLAMRWEVATAPRRTQNRNDPPSRGPELAPFANEPDTDPALPANRVWIEEVLTRRPGPPVEPITTATDAIDERVERAVVAGKAWSARSAQERRSILVEVGHALAERRGDLIAAMVEEGRKTVAQADPEVSEAIDFARYYADRALDTEPDDGSEFTPLGVVVVVPPWNFPVAIPAGGVLAALAAGNAVILKPAPETPRCAELIAEACWKGGVPADVLQFVRTPDDEVGRHLVTHPAVGGVILTGSWDTARLFKGWKPDLRLYGETSGKNAIVVSPHADLDLAASDLVRSAFGHSGQKCSAASLGILIDEVFESPRFRRQLIDAARTMTVGDPANLATVMGPVIRPAEGPLARALTDDSARWLLAPRRLDVEGRLWTPGIIDDVAPGSWFHQTECFGPVLGLMKARDLDHAIDLQNATPFGLTGGVHSLDPHEIERWVERVEVGNVYVNRHITGAIVQRQPFGGWKRSVVGTGAKAGGPNYVTQLGRWRSVTPEPVRARPRGRALELLEQVRPGFDEDEAAWLEAAAASDQAWWDREYGREHDPTGLAVESNVFRYRTRPRVVVRLEAGAERRDAARTLLAAARAGVPLEVSAAEAVPWLNGSGAPVRVEPADRLVRRLDPWDRVRVVGAVLDGLLEAAQAAEVDVVAEPVAATGRIELRWYLREQAISRTLHRFGNLIDTSGEPRHSP